MKRLFLGISFLLILFCVSSASAQSTLPVVTSLTVLPLQPVPLGEMVQVVLQLKTEAGVPVTDAPVVLSRDGFVDLLAATDEDGYAYFNFLASSGTGTYPLHILYPGSPEFSPAQSSLDLVIVPNVLKVQVVPPMSGVKFDLSGRSFESDQDGIARVWVDFPGIYHLELLPVQQTNQDYPTEFKRWEVDIFTPSRDISVPENLDLAVGFEQFFPVELNFVDLLGNPISPQRVTSVALRSSHGATNTYRLDQPIYLQRNRIVRRLDGLDDVKIRYSVLSVMVDGSNTVNQGQQVFEVTPQDPWQVELLLFSTRFTAREVFFGYSLGEGIELTYPDGRINKIPFDSDRSVEVERLARGLYSARVAGAPGVSVFTPLMISRNQNAELLVYGYPTIVLAILLPLVTAVLLLFIGRSQSKQSRKMMPAIFEQGSNLDHPKG